MVHFGDVAGRRNAAGRRLQAGDAAKVGWDPDGAAAVASDAAGRAKRRDGGGFPSAGTPGGALQVPGVVRAPDEVVVALIVREELGAVGFPDWNGPRSFQASDGRSVAGSTEILKKTASRCCG